MSPHAWDFPLTVAGEGGGFRFSVCLVRGKKGAWFLLVQFKTGKTKQLLNLISRLVVSIER